MQLIIIILKISKLVKQILEWVQIAQMGHYGNREKQIKNCLKKLLIIVQIGAPHVKK